VFVGTPETLDLAELCRERLALLSWLARALSIALQFELPQELHAAVSRASLISIVDYLVDNAIRYTPSGEQVDVRLRSFAGGIELQVLEGHGLRVAQARPVGLASTAPRVPVGSEGRYSTDTRPTPADSNTEPGEQEQSVAFPVLRRGNIWGGLGLGSPC
jgi:hypothetical protein